VLPRSRTAVLAVLLTLVLPACGGAEDESGAQHATGAPSTEPEPQAFPVTIEAENGPVVLEEQPERIVSLSPTATESLFAVGAGDQIVAVDDQSTYPAEAPRTDLSGFQPNIEAIAGYEPDLVVAGFDPGGLVDGLEKVGVRVLLQPAATDLDDAYEQVEELGAATGNVEEAEEVVESMRSRIDELTASASEAAQGLTVYHEVSPDFFSATSQTFIGSVYELLGLENIADEAGAEAPDYPQLSAEYILSADPDVVVLADTKCCGQTAKSLASRPGWRRIGAVADGHVIPVDDDIASRWGPRTVDFLEVVVEGLPEAGGS
jgi:iron complex transport system substrate-binding protein